MFSVKIFAKFKNGVFLSFFSVFNDIEKCPYFPYICSFTQILFACTYYLDTYAATPGVLKILQSKF